MNTKIAEFVERLGCLNEDIWDEMRSQVKRFKNHQTPSYDKDKIDTLEKNLKAFSAKLKIFFPMRTLSLK